MMFSWLETQFLMDSVRRGVKREHLSGIYKIHCHVNDKAYVGSSVDVFGRVIGHRKKLIRGDHCNPKLQNAWNKYGRDSFTFSVLEICPRDRTILIAREQYWIDELGTFVNGLNGRPTANNMAGIKWSTETNRKRSVSMSKTIATKPRVHLSKEHMAAMASGRKESFKKGRFIKRISGVFFSNDFFNQSSPC